MWSAIVNFLASIIDLFYDWTGNFGIAVILFTILVKGLMLPLDLKSKRSTAQMQAIQPEIQRINEKYANDPEKKNKKLQEIYVQHHINPLGGCLPLLLTMPIVIIIFAALKNIASEHMYAYMEAVLVDYDGGMKDFLANIGAMINESDVMKTSLRDMLPALINNSGNLPAALEKLPEVITQENTDILLNAIKNIDMDRAQVLSREMGYNFLWIKNIWAPDSPLKTILGSSIPFGNMFGETAAIAWATCNGFFVLPIVSTVSQYYHTYLMNKKQKKAMAEAAAKSKKKTAEDPSQNTMKIMNKIFPLMSLYFCATYNGAFALYWTISNFVSIAQMFITDYIINKKKVSKD